MSIAAHPARPTPAHRAFRFDIRPGALLAAWLVMTALILTGCTGAGEGPLPEDDGRVVIGLTDLEGDFVSYMVDVISLTLSRADGAVVETLPIRTRLDFARYTDMTEFLTAATVPPGGYTRATLTLDYTDAEIWVENAQGAPERAGTVQDSQGLPIDTLEATVHLQGGNALRILPGIPSHLTLDFDLRASHQVELPPGGSPVVTVRPFLVADVDPSDPKLHRLRGALARVGSRTGTFDVLLRPFAQALHGPQEPFGTLTVQTNGDTVFDHGGTAYVGREGLLAMEELPRLTATLILGDLRFHPPRFEAREVRTGTSVPGGTLDVVSGHMMAREGDVLRVRGATLVRSGGSMIFHDAVSVQLGDGTVVRRELDPQEGDTDDISVGQQITAGGTLTGDIPGALVLDASAGVVHLEMIP